MRYYARQLGFWSLSINIGEAQKVKTKILDQTEKFLPDC